MSQTRRIITKYLPDVGHELWCVYADEKDVTCLSAVAALAEVRLITTQEIQDTGGINENIVTFEIQPILVDELHWAQPGLGLPPEGKQWRLFPTRGDAWTAFSHLAGGAHAQD